MDVPWLVANDVAEKQAARTAAASDGGGEGDGGNGIGIGKIKKLRPVDASLRGWLESRGGVFTDVDVAFIAGKPCGGAGLVSTAKELLRQGTHVVTVPAAFTLSAFTARNYKAGKARVGEPLVSLLRDHPIVGLSVMLLHEHFKEHTSSVSSRMGPYVRSLGRPELGSPVLRALRGTYAAEVLRLENTATDAAYGLITAAPHGVCVRSPPLCSRNHSLPFSGPFTKDDVRWALGVVRSRAVRVRRHHGKKMGSFLALVPAVDPGTQNNVQRTMYNVQCTTYNVCDAYHITCTRLFVCLFLCVCVCFSHIARVMRCRSADTAPSPRRWFGHHGARQHRSVGFG